MRYLIRLKMKELDRSDVDAIEFPVFQHITDHKEHAAYSNSTNHIKNWQNGWLAMKCITHKVVELIGKGVCNYILVDMRRAAIMCAIWRIFYRHTKIIERLLL
jgi:hypothetical protein